MLADLPVEALRLTPATVILLKRLGLYRVGELYGLPRASLARRFRDQRGPARGVAPGELADGVVLRLDQALGAIREPRRPMPPIPRRLVRQVFAEPLIATAGIETAVSAAIAQLCALLAQAGEGARQLCLALYRTDGSQADITVGTSSPSRDELHIGRLFAEKLGTVDLGFGVDVITLEGQVVAPLDAVQAGLGAKPQTEGAQGLAQLIDRLSNRVGAAAVYRVAHRRSHIPEQADTMLPALAPRCEIEASSRAVLALRPPFMLGRPEPIEAIAEVPEGPPRRFRWRRAGHRIVKAEGPERIEPAWWEAIAAAPSEGSPRPRDYYRVEDEQGGRFWVFREGRYDCDGEVRQPVWFMHGLFG
jgi:protein ImuB